MSEKIVTRGPADMGVSPTALHTPNRPSSSRQRSNGGEADPQADAKGQANRAAESLTSRIGPTLPQIIGSSEGSQRSTSQEQLASTRRARNRGRQLLPANPRTHRRNLRVDHRAANLPPTLVTRASPLPAMQVDQPSRPTEPTPMVPARPSTAMVHMPATPTAVMATATIQPQHGNLAVRPKPSTDRQ